MYGPTGSGKSHTMFGSPKQPCIVYGALRDILGDVDEEEADSHIGFGTFVQVSVLEIYNEEIYDLFSSNNGGGFGLGWHKGSASKAAAHSHVNYIQRSNISYCHQHGLYSSAPGNRGAEVQSLQLGADAMITLEPGTAHCCLEGKLVEFPYVKTKQYGRWKIQYIRDELCVIRTKVTQD